VIFFFCHFPLKVACNSKSTAASSKSICIVHLRSVLWEDGWGRLCK
jgi:hypothetical protein